MTLASFYYLCDGKLLITCPSMREAISPIASFIGYLALSLEDFIPYSHSAFNAGNVILRLVNFIVHNTSKRREEIAFFIRSWQSLSACIPIFLLVKKKTIFGSRRTSDRKLSLSESAPELVCLTIFQSITISVFNQTELLSEFSSASDNERWRGNRIQWWKWALPRSVFFRKWNEELQETEIGT